MFAANGCPRGHNYSIWRRLVFSAALAGQIKCNCAVKKHCLALCFLCWQPPGLAFSSPAGRNTGLQGQRLHLSIYHTDWPAKCTSALPLSFPLSTISLRLCHSFILLLQPPLPQTVPHLSIHPSSVFKHLSLCCQHPSVLFLAHSFCVSSPPVSSSPPAHACLRVSTQLKCPEGPSFKHRNQKHMAHFQLPRSITAIYPEIAAKFPKVSSRFTTDCNVCLSHFKSGQFPLLPSTPCDFPSNVSKAFKWVLDMFYLWLSCAPSFLLQFCEVQVLLATQI